MIKKRKIIQNNNFLSGIDLGSDKCCCAIGEKNPDTGKIDLLGIGEKKTSGIKKGSIIDREKIIEDISDAVVMAEELAGVKIDRANVTISGNHIRSINTQGAISIHPSNLPVPKAIEPNDVKKVLEMARAISFPADRSILHVIPQEYIIDTMDGVINPIGMMGRRLEAQVHLITVSYSSITNIGFNLNI